VIGTWNRKYAGEEQNVVWDVAEQIPSDRDLERDMAENQATHDADRLQNKSQVIGTWNLFEWLSEHSYLYSVGGQIPKRLEITVVVVVAF